MHVLPKIGHAQTIFTESNVAPYLPFEVSSRLQLIICRIDHIGLQIQTTILRIGVIVIQLQPIVIDRIRIEITQRRCHRMPPYSTSDLKLERTSRHHNLRKTPSQIDPWIEKEFPSQIILFRYIQQCRCPKTCLNFKPVASHSHRTAILKKQRKVMSCRDIVIRSWAGGQSRRNWQQRIINLPPTVIFIHLPIGANHQIVFSTISLHAKTSDQFGICIKWQTLYPTGRHILCRQPTAIMYPLLIRQRRCCLSA